MFGSVMVIVGTSAVAGGGFSAAQQVQSTVAAAAAGREAGRAATSESGGQSVDADAIVVTAARTPTPITAIPQTVRVLDRAEVETQLALSPSLLDSLAFSIPSLAPGRQKLTSTGESLRGRTPLYLVDGVPQSTPLRDGKRSGFTVDPAFVDRVEVIFGANAIQGVGATGGIINYVTVSPPRSGGWLSRVTAELSSDDLEADGFHYRVSGLAGRRVGAFDFVAGAAFERHGLFYSGDDRPVAVDSVQGELMDSRAYSLFAKAGVEPAPGQRLEAMVNLYDIATDGDFRVVAGNLNAGIPATSIRGAPPGEPTFTEALNTSLTYTHEDILGGRLNLQGFYYDFYALYGGGTFPVFQDPLIAPRGTLFDQSALASEKYGARFTYSHRNLLWPGFQLVTGADYLRDRSSQELALTGRIWVPELYYNGWAPFLQLEQALANDRVRLSGGVRWEHATLDVPAFTTIASANRTPVAGGSPSFQELLVNAGLVVEPLDGLTLFGSYAQGFTMPDAGLILRAVNRPGQSVDELVDLQPIVADNVELGAAFRRGGIELQGSYFWSNAALGSRIQVIGGAGFVVRERTEIQGFELSARYALRGGYRLGAALAVLDGRYDSNGDERVDRDLDGRNIGPNRLNAFVEGPIAGPLSGRLQVSHLFDRDFDGGLPKFNFDGYTLADVLLSYDGGAAGRFSLGVSNLLDEQYVTYFAQTVNFVDNESYVAGRGRAFTLRWQGSF